MDEQTNDERADEPQNSEDAVSSPDPEPAAREGSSPVNAPAATTSADSAKTNAILAWIFAPITSYVWKDESDPLLRNHARESLYLGVANLAVMVILWVLSIFFSIFLIGGFGIIFWGFMNLLQLANLAFIIVPRVMGIMKANNRETWEVPYVSEFMRRFIKL